MCVFILQFCSNRRNPLGLERTNDVRFRYDSGGQFLWRTFGVHIFKQQLKTCVVQICLELISFCLFAFAL